MEKIAFRPYFKTLVKKKKKPKFFKFIQSQLFTSIGHICVFWQIVFFYLPIGFLITKSLLRIISNKHNIVITDFVNIEYLHICLNSLTLCLTTTLLTLTLGLCIAYTLAFHIKRYKNLIFLLIIIPFWTNFALHMYSWFFILQPDGPVNTLLLKLNLISNPLNLVNTKFSVYLMMCYYYLPFMLISIYTSFQRFDYKLIEASKNLGAKSSTTFFKILLPLNIKGIRTGIFLVLIPSFGEFIIPEMMGGDTKTFIGNAITLFILGNNSQQEGLVLTFFSLLIILTTVLIVDRLLKKVSRIASRGQI